MLQRSQVSLLERNITSFFLLIRNSLSVFRVFEVTHDRQATNEKELTIKVGELLEVLDDKRNWWRLRNFQGEIGHAPLTILRPFEFNEPNNGYYDSEKVGYF